MKRFTTLLALTPLLACGGASKEETGGETGEPLTCEEPAGANAMEPGDWTFTIDEEIENNCENAQGHGVHIHVGEDTMLTLMRDGTCVEGYDEPFMVDGNELQTIWEGSTDGDEMVLEGWVEIPLGTCWIGITPTLTATMTSSTTLEYRVDAVVDVSREGTYQNGEWVDIADACAITMGDEPHHSLPQLPCTQAWRGTASLTSAAGE